MCKSVERESGTGDGFKKEKLMQIREKESQTGVRNNTLRHQEWIELVYKRKDRRGA